MEKSGEQVCKGSMEDAPGWERKNKGHSKIFSVPAKRSVRIDKDTGSETTLEKQLEWEGLKKGKQVSKNKNC